MLGELIGAGGQLAGGIIAANGGLNSGDVINPVFDPNLDLATQASLFNALSGLGFGTVNNLPDPVQELAGRLQRMSIDEKTKRRALVALEGIAPRMQNWDLSFDQAFKRTRNGGRLEQAMSRLGLSKGGLSDIFERQASQAEQVRKLKEAGLGELNLETILARYKAANEASKMLGDASNYARTGETKGIFGDLVSRDNRMLEDFATRAGLQANFGGASQAAAQKAISDQQLDQNLRVLEQALGISSGIQAALNPATAASTAGAAGAASSAQIAAQQAAAANALRNQSSADQALSLGNAISGAAGSVGSGVSDIHNVLGMLLGSNFSGNAGLGGAGIGSAVNGFGAAGGAAGAAGGSSGLVGGAGAAGGGLSSLSSLFLL